MRRSRHDATARCIALLALAALVPACGGGGGGGGGGAAPTPVVLVSSNAAGTQGDGNSDQSSVSSDGQFVAFRSTSTNFVAGANAFAQIYRKDMVTGTIIRVSETPADAAGNGASSRPVISPDGRWIAFVSESTDLITAGTFAGGGRTNVFLYDALNDVTTLMSGLAGSATAEATGNSGFPAIAVLAGPVVHVAFHSSAQDLIAGLTGYNGVDATNVYRKTNGTTLLTLVSASNGSPTVVGNDVSARPTMSANGNFVAFQSMATNLTAAADTNGSSDVFVRTMAGAIARVSLRNDDGQITGGSGSAFISPSGAHVVFQSTGTDLGDTGGLPADIYIRSDWDGGAAAATTQMSEHPSSTGTGNSCNDPVLSSDGNLVVWASDSFELINGDTNALRDVFQRNRTANTLQRISLSNTGAEMTGGGANIAIQSSLSITPSGSFVTFDSAGTNLVVPATTNRQVFRRG